MSVIIWLPGKGLERLAMGSVMVPPYLPISCSGTRTRMSCGSRSATAGSSPAATRSASSGDSLNAVMALPVSRT